MAIRLGTVGPVGFDEFADPQWMACMRQLGARSVQVYRNRHGNDNSHTGAVTTRQMKDYLEATGLPCDSIHGLYGNDLDPSCPDEAERAAVVDVFKREGDLALELGGPLVVVHCSGIYEREVSPAELATYRRQLRKSIEELGRYGRDNGVRYAFENLPKRHAYGWDVADLAALLAEVDLTSVGMCFDVAHANLAGDPILSASQADDQIIYLHVSDNFGQKDNHLMPFCGRIDFDAFARALATIEFDGVLMLETFYSVDDIRRLIDDGYAEKLARFVTAAGG
jgi:sugar phosphate isomerase/epimerase